MVTIAMVTMTYCKGYHWYDYHHGYYCNGNNDLL